MPIRYCYTVLGIGLALLAALTLIQGSVSWDLAWRGALAKLLGHSNDWSPLLDERLPRLIVMICTGASLALSGAVMQALFHNPLASPSVLGISCGGSLMVVIVSILQWHLHYPYVIPLAAIGGSLSTLLVVYGLSMHRGELIFHNLILTGIAVSTLLIAVQGVIMYVLRDQWQLIQTLTEWEAATTADRSWKHVHMQLPLTIVGTAGCWHYRKEIDILALGDEEATNLGVEVSKIRWRLFLCVALLTGGALAGIGIIAFFGLVLPHLLRKLAGASNYKLIPLCILAGALVLMSLDLILRTFGWQYFTIGNISAVLGGLFFLILLFGNKRMLET